MKGLIIEKIGEEAYDLVSKYVDLESEKTFIVSTTNDFNILNERKEHDAIINLSKVNNIRFINKFFESVNKKSKDNEFFIGRFETFSARRARMWIHKVPILRSFYFSMEFIFLRMFPKMKGFKKIYFLLTRGRNRLLSKAEVLGRLVSCGFEVIDYQSIDGLVYFITKKVKAPTYNMNPSYGPLYKMPRVGKGGKIINVYKFRTMHPYAEYLQDYVVKNNGYSDIGKPADDFRLTVWGKFMRKYWLDELPQLLNVIKGEMKLVGARPISERFLIEYPEDIKQIRNKYKPGCFPPYVALLKQGVTESMDAERIYFDHKTRHPYTTDIKFLFKSLYNIITNKIRSS